MFLAIGISLVVGVAGGFVLGHLKYSSRLNAIQMEVVQMAGHPVDAVRTFAARLKAFL